MKHLFIINPNAGKKRTERRLERAIHDLEEPWEIVYTAKESDATRYARAAAESGAPVRIYACGGDGTLNAVVNGAAGFDNAAVTNIPLGTGNDFLKIFGPKNTKRFLDVAALSKGPQAAMDLIDCNGKLGIDIVCAGIDARIAADADRYKRLPLVKGMGAYALALVENVLFKSITQPTAVDVEDLHFDGETTVIAVCSGRYYGGGFMPIGDNMPDDGVLETLIVPKVSRTTFFRLVGDYAKGLYRKYPDLIWKRSGTSMTLKGERDIVAVVDGEVMRAREYTIRLSEKKLNFFYPADLSYDRR